MKTCCSDRGRIEIGPWLLLEAGVPVPETVDYMNVAGLGADRVGWSIRDSETGVRWVVCSDGLAWPDPFDPLTYGLLRVALRLQSGRA